MSLIESKNVSYNQKAPPHFVQTDRETHEQWALLTLKKPAAAALMHVFASRIGDHNAVVASYSTLAQIMGVSQMTIRRAVETLKQGRWIEVTQIGGSGSSNAYILNDKVAWVMHRDKLKYSLFSATVIANGQEQPDAEHLSQRPELRKLPRVGDIQLPFGDGIAPPSQSFLDGMEPELPTIPSGFPSNIEQD